MYQPQLLVSFALAVILIGIVTLASAGALNLWYGMVLLRGSCAVSVVMLKPGLLDSAYIAAVTVIVSSRC